MDHVLSLNFFHPVIPHLIEDVFPYEGLCPDVLSFGGMCYFDFFSVLLGAPLLTSLPDSLEDPVHPSPSPIEVPPARSLFYHLVTEFFYP